MFTTTKTTREKALVAVEATQRAMGRHVCCKSQYKFKCFSCGEFINRGDKITKCNRATTGMKLRYRGADSINGLTMAETCFYQGESGKDMWVHIGCNPCYWDSLLENSNEYSPRALRPILTGWGCKISNEFLDWCDSLPGNVFRSEPLFFQMKGYPQEKPMKKRIIHAVTRFQTIWRGYLLDKALEIALQQQREQREQREQRARFALSQEVLRNSPQVGDHIEVLFNRNQPTETVYSAEVIEVQYRGCEDNKIKVKYHYDGEVRKYTGKKFKLLKKECEEHKMKLGIEAKLTGRLNTAGIGLILGVATAVPPNEDWRYHYPDGTPVE